VSAFTARSQPFPGGVVYVHKLGLLLHERASSQTPEHLAAVQQSLRDGFLRLLLRGSPILTVTGGDVPFRFAGGPSLTSARYREFNPAVECDSWEWVGSPDSCALILGIICSFPDGAIVDWQRVQ
jgi:hypothetical protein